MAYTAAEFKAKTTELIQTIEAEQRASIGSYASQNLYTPAAVVSDLIDYISSNSADPRTFGYEIIGEDLFIKPRNYISVKLYPF